MQRQGLFAGRRFVTSMVFSAAARDRRFAQVRTMHKNVGIKTATITRQVAASEHST